MSSKPNTSIEALERLADVIRDDGNLGMVALPDGRVVDLRTSENRRYVGKDVSGNCTDPVVVNRYSRATEDPRALREGRATRVSHDKKPPVGRIGSIIVPRHEIVREPKPVRLGMEVTLLTRCRKCLNCRRMRAAMWRFRAVAECEQAGRNWFGTLTLRPEVHYHHDALLRAGVKDKRGRWLWEPEDNWADLTEDARCALRFKAVGRELQLWLKRVRKNSGVPFRYLAVGEIHDGGKRSRIKDPELRSHCVTGFPHIHILIHEYSGAPLLKKFLTGRWVDRIQAWETEPSWSLGFTHFKLLPPDDVTKGAMYACKYLTDDWRAKIWPSKHYGGVTQSLCDDDLAA